MPPAVTDPFPSQIEILRTRRRSVELRLDHGRLVARVPLRIAKWELDDLLLRLRAQLWEELSRKRVFDPQALDDCAARVARKHLADLDLPPYELRFSRRQNRRWGSCTYDPSTQTGRIRISERLRGHPVWVLEHLLLHELIHLRVPDHGPRFHALMKRCPHRERAEGYLEALEGLALLGDELPSGEGLLARMDLSIAAKPSHEKGEIFPTVVHGVEDLPLFDSRDPIG